MKTPLVFSFVKEQRTFLTLLMSLLTFLAVLCLGLAIALGTAVRTWNAQWDMMATVQVLPQGDWTGALRALDSVRADIAAENHITEAEAARMLRPWLKDGDALGQYIPKMVEVKFKSRAGLNAAGDKIKDVPGARFVRHTDGMKASARAGWKVIILSVLILFLVMGAIVACVSYITKNTTLIHRRELEILNQIGARDSFVARQLMKAIAKICLAAAVIGFALAAPALMVITSIAHSMRVGMFTQMTISGAGWAVLAGLAAGIIILAVSAARKTSMRILRNC